MVKFNSESSVEIIKRLGIDDEDANNNDDGSLTVMELGPGNGFSLKELIATNKCKRIYGIEISERFRTLLHGKYSDEIKDGLLSIHENDAKNLDFLEDSTIDALYALNVIYFLDPLDAYLTEIHRICKPGAKVVFGVSDAVKSNDDAVFVNQDWEECVSKMKLSGFFSDVDLSDDMELGMFSFAFISGIVNNKPN